MKKPLYNAMSTALSLVSDPQVLPLSWLVPPCFQDPAPADPWVVTPAEVDRAVAKAVLGGPTYADAYAIGGAPVALDYEWWAKDGQPMPLDVFGDFVFAFKSRAPHMTVGVWGADLWGGVLATQFAKLTTAQKAAMDAAVKRHRALVATYDVLHVACYMDRLTNAEQQIDGLALLYRWLKKAYGKPVWAWLGNWYWGDPRGADTRLPQLTRDHAANLCSRTTGGRGGRSIGRRRWIRIAGW
jgi:hypothetical protein